MADGAGAPQRAFNFPRNAIVSALHPGEIVIDLFAGGGGASEALRQALGRDPDIAINHDEWAIGMHAANHPFTFHLPEDVWHADPRRLVAARPVGWMHASPDCTHFSQAKGGQPRDPATRSLTWVVRKWAGTVRPRIISLENVVQILQWCPLIAKRDKATGRVVTLDLVRDPATGRMVNRIAEPGEHVPLRQQYLVPDRRRLGSIWRQFVRALETLGYVVECRALVARDFGAGTDRKRLFMIARCDGKPIRWPARTHGTASGEQRPATGADSIDWSVLGASIFNRSRPLRPNTIRRLLDGARRGHWPQVYVDALTALRDGKVPNLDITPAQAEEIAQQLGHAPGMVMATGGGGVARSVERPLPTIVAGCNGLAPHFIRPVIVHKQNSAGGRGARRIDEPLPTITTNGAGRLAVPALLAVHSTAKARPVTEPVPTITTGGAANQKRPGCARPQVFEPIIAPYYGSGSGCTGQPASRTLPTITTKARLGLAEPVVVSTCNSSSVGVRLASDPLRTITTARGGDQAVAEPVVAGYRIDILYRMLFERELFNAQGFPPDYVIDRTADGRRLTRTQAIRMVGNSVSPPPLRAIAQANLDPVEVDQREAA